jgi:hypothetical protein
VEAALGQRERNGVWLGEELSDGVHDSHAQGPGSHPHHENKKRKGKKIEAQIICVWKVRVRKQDRKKKNILRV